MVVSKVYFRFFYDYDAHHGCEREICSVTSSVGRFYDYHGNARPVVATSKTQKTLEGGYFN